MPLQFLALAPLWWTLLIINSDARGRASCSRQACEEKQGLVLVLFLLLFVIGVPLLMLYCMPLRQNYREFAQAPESTRLGDASCFLAGAPRPWTTTASPVKPTRCVLWDQIPRQSFTHAGKCTACGHRQVLAEGFSPSLDARQLQDCLSHVAWHLGAIRVPSLLWPGADPESLLSGGEAQEGGGDMNCPMPAPLKP